MRMMAGALVAVLFLGFAGPVGAQQKVASVMLCFPDGKVKESMARRFGEVPRFQAVTNDGRMLELLANEDGSSRTLHLVDPGKSSCVMASGQGVFAIPYKAPEQGS